MLHGLDDAVEVFERSVPYSSLGGACTEIYAVDATTSCEPVTTQVHGERPTNPYCVGPDGVRTPASLLAPVSCSLHWARKFLWLMQSLLQRKLPDAEDDDLG